MKKLAIMFNKNMNDLKDYNYVWNYYHFIRKEIQDMILVPKYEIENMINGKAN
ncbi:MAG: hypothetical protein WC390_07080 [Sulfurimonas sp.]